MTARHHITALRAQALTLHKQMIDEARVRYETQHGRVIAPGEMLRLVAFDPEFAWLKPLTGLILEMDDRLDQPELTAADADAVKLQLAQVLKGKGDALAAPVARA